jgi:hypothetical protein
MNLMSFDIYPPTLEGIELGVDPPRSYIDAVIIVDASAVVVVASYHKVV